MTHASPSAEAPARIARKGTAPQRSAAQGALPGFESVWLMYRYPARPVNRPMAVELNVKSNLTSVSASISAVQLELSLSAKLTI